MNSEKGQNMIELVVVISVAVVVVSALAIITLTTLKNSQFSQNQTQATKLAQEGIEKVRSLRNRDEVGKVQYIAPPGASKFSDLWNINLSCTTSTNLNCYFRFETGDILNNVDRFEDLANNFKRKIQIEDIGNGLQEKELTVVVLWNDYSGEHESRLSTILRKI